MPDYGARVADKAIEQTARKLRSVYRQAAEELRKNLADFTRKHKAKDEAMRKKLAEGLITQQDYANWQKGQLFMEKQWKDKIDQCARIMDNANVEAAEIVGKKKMDVFAENYNHAAYELEKKARGAVSFNMYDEKTVAKLVKENPKMLPEWKVNKRKDYAWNRQKVENSITQGIIQGEGIEKITDRLVSNLCTQNESKMRTFARTAVTGAQNAGRQAQMKDAEAEGIKVKKRWIATLDSRTRDLHAELDGQEVPVDEPFTIGGYKIDYPGDPSAEPEMVYNCRCTMIEVYEGIDRVSVRRDEDDNEVADMTYKEWKEAKENGTLNTEKKLVETPTFRGVDEYAGYEKVAEDVSFGELFDEEQKQITEQTLTSLSEEYPLETPLSFVGDARLLYDIPIDADHLDIAEDPDLEKKWGGISAQFNKDLSGNKVIAVFNESLGTMPLKEEFDIMHELRLKYGEQAMLLDEALCFDSTSGTVEGTITHEYAHALAEQAGIFKTIKEGSREFNDWLFEYWETHRDEVRLISRYAATHPHEMLAESFVQIHDTDHPDTIAFKIASEVWSEFTAFTKKIGRWAK